MEETAQRCDLVICPGALGDTVLRILAVAVLLERGELRPPVRLLGTFPYLRLAGFFLPEVHVEDFDVGPWWALFAEERLGSPLRDGLQSVEKAIIWLEDSGQAKRKLEEIGISVVALSDDRGSSDRHKLEVLTGLRPEELQERLEALAACGRFFSSHGRSHVVIHPGAGSSLKRMPSTFFRDVAVSFAGKGDRVVWLIGPAEAEDAQLLQVPSGAELVVEPSLEKLVSLLRRARLFVGNDAGVAHLAAVTGTPVVSFFRATDPARWHPVGPQVYVVDCRDEIAPRVTPYRYLRPQPGTNLPDTVRLVVQRLGVR